MRVQKASARSTARELLARLGVEALFGLVFAAILVIVAWASSNAIHFVYGGY